MRDTPDDGWILRYVFYLFMGYVYKHLGGRIIINVEIYIQYLRYGFNESLSFPKSEINPLHDCIEMNTTTDTQRNEILDSTTMSLWSTNAAPSIPHCKTIW